MNDKPFEIAWKPEPKQRIALSCPAFELFYGGARFGGKSDFLLADFLDGIAYGENHRGILFRKSYSELEELTFRSKQLYPVVGGKYSETKRTWTFPSGAALKMRFIELDKDVEKYQGHAYPWVGFDELTNWSNDYCYTYMHSCARSAHGLPVRVRASGNPGSAGHGWVKARFVDVAKAMNIYYDPDTGLPRIFIPSTLDDNSYAKNDPDYERRLKGLPRHLYKAHRFGDWSVFVGQAFDVNSLHIIKPIPIPQYAQIYMTFDWGFGRPFSVGWWWTDGDGRVYRCGEWYGFSGKPNEGIRLNDPEIAAGILKKQEALGISGRRIIAIGGPDCFSKKPDYKGGGQGPSTSEIFSQSNIYLTPGDASRHLKIRQFRQRLMVPRNDQGDITDIPMMQIYDTCTEFLRTIPSLVVDSTNPEDIDTNGEDHIYDEACHICMARPMSLAEAKQTKTPAAEHIERQISGKASDYERAARTAGLSAWRDVEIGLKRQKGTYSDVDGR
jgi:hypothetical protein